MTKRTTRLNADDGFSLAELMVVVGVISVVMVGATVVAPSVLKQSRADGSTTLVVNTLRLARDRAIGERRNMDVVFVPPDRIKIVREEIVYNSVTGTWSSTYGLTSNPTVMDVVLENGQQFVYYTGMADTPDLFGRTNVPLAFGTVAAPLPTIMFTSEGSLVDASGDPINGTVFLATGSDKTSARAVTIFGATGLLRTWKWDGVKWAE